MPTKIWEAICAALPSSWATYLPWVENAHNTLISSATDMSPFMVNGYQPPLFRSQETNVAVPSIVSPSSLAEDQVSSGKNGGAQLPAGRPMPDPGSQLPGWQEGLAFNS